MAPLAHGQHTIDGGLTETLPGTHPSGWDAGGTLAIGDTGIGALTLTGATATATNVILGDDATTGSGTLTLTDGSTFTASAAANGVIVGNNGSGFLNLSGGSVLNLATGSTMRVGYLAGAQGTATITGGGSRVNSSVSVGFTGTGELTLSSGAEISGAIGQIGWNATGNGTATVTGAGSKWTTTGNFTIANNAGAQGALVIADQGEVVVGGTLNMSGTGLAGAGALGTLEISGGGKLTAATANLGVSGFASTVVSVSGEGSTLKGNSMIFGAGGAGSGTDTLTVSDGGTVIVGATGIGTFRLGRANTTLNIGNGGAAGTVQARTLSSATAAKLNFNHTGTTSFTPVVSGSITVTKTGSGTTILGTASTYSGTTSVEEGTFLANGTLGITTVTVADGATYGGTGIHSGATILESGATISPGMGVGNFTTGSATFGAGANYLWQLGDAAGTAGSGWDLLTITGGLALAATAEDPFLITLGKAASLSGFDPLQDYEFTIATAAGGITGFSEGAFLIDSSGIPESGDGVWSLGRSGDSLVLAYSAVPEPSAGALGLIGMIALLRRRRVH